MASSNTSQTSSGKSMATSRAGDELPTPQQTEQPTIPDPQVPLVTNSTGKIHFEPCKNDAKDEPDEDDLPFSEVKKTCDKFGKNCNTISALPKHSYDHTEKAKLNPCTDCGKHFHL